MSMLTSLALHQSGTASGTATGTAASHWRLFSIARNVKTYLDELYQLTSATTPAPNPAQKEKKVSNTIRHVLLIRHGQYELEDEAHGLTPLGVNQSQLTGARLAAMTAGIKKDHYGEYKYGKVVGAMRASESDMLPLIADCSSNVLRAKQTADHIADALAHVPRLEDDPLLAEGYPCIPHPGGGLLSPPRPKP
eukprot:1183631-Prorocentrum_minimum.AAC.2